jgi:hypothetical protein
MGPITVYEAEAGEASIKINQPREEGVTMLRAGDRIFVEAADALSGQVFSLQ